MIISYSFVCNKLVGFFVVDNYQQLLEQKNSLSNQKK